MANPVFFLLFVLLGGGSLIGGLLGVRLRDQRGRDARRAVVELGFPRGVKEAQIVAVVRAIIGLAPGGRGLSGRDSVAWEVVGTRTAVKFRLRLPAVSDSYLIAQLRAALPGLSVTEIDDFVPEQCRLALELRRRITASDLATSDAVAISRTILAAMAGLGRDEVMIWQVIMPGGISARPAEQLPVWQRLSGHEVDTPATNRRDGGIVGVVVRLGAIAETDKRAGELVARLRRAASSVSAPKACLVARPIPNALVSSRIARAATPILAAPVLLEPEKELPGLLGAPLESILVPGVTLGGSPQLPVPASVPSRGRVLGTSTVTGWHVAQPLKGAAEHSLIIGPTGSGKSWLAARLILSDIAAGRGAFLIDPKGGTADAIVERMPEEAISRTVIVDPMDEERPVPMPLLAGEAGGIPELGADTLVSLLRHRYRDLGPRSSDVLSSSLYALARVPDATLMDLLPLWSDARFRAKVAAAVNDEPVLAGCRRP